MRDETRRCRGKGGVVECVRDDASSGHSGFHHGERAYLARGVRRCHRGEAGRVVLDAVGEFADAEGWA